MKRDFQTVLAKATDDLNREYYGKHYDEFKKANARILKAESLLSEVQDELFVRNSYETRYKQRVRLADMITKYFMERNQ